MAVIFYSEGIETKEITVKLLKITKQTVCSACNVDKFKASVIKFVTKL